LILALLVGACATPYQESGLGGGYTQKEIETDIWRVAFNGNGHTTRETVQTYWLYRCAELAQEKGFDGFEIMSGMQFTGLQGLPRQTASPLLHQAKGGGFIYVPTYSGPSYFPSFEGDIRMLKKPFQPAVPKVFDAAEIKVALEKYVKGEKCEKNNVCPHVHRYVYPPGDGRLPAS
jgi:hypothetical protein